MADVFSPEKRSWMMSRIRGRDTGIDRTVRTILDDLGCEYEMYPKMDGNPDFTIPEERIAIFCDGDFWHGYKYAEKRKPAKKFWRDKIEGNMRRDKKISRRLRSDGWSVLRFWEHDIERNPEKCKRRILRKMTRSS
ncbi:MAG: very short patch repair endonuclease [Candidatus Nitrosotenuis sp.]